MIKFNKNVICVFLILLFLILYKKSSFGSNAKGGLPIISKLKAGANLATAGLISSTKSKQAGKNYLQLNDKYIKKIGFEKIINGFKDKIILESRYLNEINKNEDLIMQALHDDAYHHSEKYQETFKHYNDINTGINKLRKANYKQMLEINDNLSKIINNKKILTNERIQDNYFRNVDISEGKGNYNDALGEYAKIFERLP